MWCPNDHQGFYQNTTGQVHDDCLAEWITRLCEDPENKTFLEVGTWNGLGSTRAFVNVLKDRDDTVFYSLECNKEKVAYAQKFHEGVANVHILNEVLVHLTPEQVYDVFPQARDDAEFNRWNTVDITNMKECKLFDACEDFDVVLLDGGEFTTWHEFQKIKNHVKYLLLDDTNTNKCVKIVEEIKDDPDTWKILEHDADARNGAMLVQHICN